jgi:hypothetical protein
MRPSARGQRRASVRAPAVSHAWVLGVTLAWFAGCGAAGESDEGSRPLVAAAADPELALAEVTQQPGEVRALPGPQARELLAGGLARAERVRWREPSAGSSVPSATATFGVQRDAAGVPVLIVQLDVGGAAGAGLATTVTFERVDGTIDLARDLPEAAARLAAVLDAKVALAAGDREAIARLLGSSDVELTLLALSWCADHRAPELSGSLLDRVADEDDRVALGAIEALATCGSEGDVPRLLRRARLGDPTHARRVFETLAALGGPDAVGYLGFATRNEDDPRLVDAARRALDQLQRGPRPGPESIAPPPSPRGHR